MDENSKRMYALTDRGSLNHSFGIAVGCQFTHSSLNSRSVSLRSFSFATRFNLFSLFCLSPNFNGPFQASFSYFRLFKTDLIELKQNKICQWLHSNCGSLVSEATALQTKPQPLFNPSVYFTFNLKLCMDQKLIRTYVRLW